MDQIAELAKSIFRDKVRRAREIPPMNKLRAGPELFDFVCRIARYGIRMQHPNADEAEVERLLDERLALQRRIERRHRHDQR